MKSSLLLIVFLAVSQLSFAQNSHDLNGVWIYQDAQDPDHFMNLRVKIEPSELVVLQCSQKFSSDRLSCLNFKYQIQSEKIYSENRLVGDLYPYALQVYDSSTQMAELLKLYLPKPDRLEFTYSYTNMDGVAVYQKANLIKKTTD